MMPFMRPLLHYGLPSPRCEVVVPDLICPAGKVPLEEGAAACLPDNCAGILGFELDENDLSNPEIIRDFATITYWCGCYLVPDYPRCAPKTALQFLVYTVDTPAVLRDALCSRLDYRAGGTVRPLSVMCNDRHHCIAHVRLPLNLMEGFGKFHHTASKRHVQGGPCGVVAVNCHHGEAKACGQTAWADDTEGLVAGTTSPGSSHTSHPLRHSHTQS